MSSLIVIFVIWILLGVAIGYAAGRIFKGERPHGLNGDLIASVLSFIAIGLADWYLVPILFPKLARGLVFGAALVEPLLTALIVLWLMRYLKNR